MKSSQLKNVILRLVQGGIIGAGAILPGISGGVLAVVFGIYRPMMETLTHPKAGLAKYWRLFLPIGVGWAAGFLGGGSAILLLLRSSETVATALFVGLILGTIPALWREAGTQGRGSASITAMVLSFLALFSLLLFVQLGSFSAMRQNFGGFLFCGALWGLSMIVPGMTSSSILMAVGLLTPMIDGITSLDFGVLAPWTIGFIGVIAVFARLVNWLFKAHYAVAAHAVVGIVLASTLIIVPLHYASAAELALSIACAVGGALLAHFSGGIKAPEET